ncbi:Helicase ARIP4 [Phytophthora citrophthora]|uniref:Helicase ARIP4 n=1 Tax=Phytophthora citrophthora TaxID=4793 RepID=A0AAD9LQE8_9STRA|nr:Helicase ARIP4 [Phytophthora citrophthora]
MSSDLEEIDERMDEEEASSTEGEAEWDPNASEEEEEGEEGTIDAFFKPNTNKSSRQNSTNGKKKHTSGKKRKAKPSERSERWNRRRKIADVMDDEDLDDNTRKAREAEAKRAKKIDDILGNFSALSEDQLAVPDEDDEKRMCLNPISADGAPPTGEEGTEDAPIYVYQDLVNKLKPHQVVGARFMWAHVAVEPNGFGCVLADFMGLGKTLQVITTVQAFLSKKTLDEDGDLVQRHKHVLILAPTICVRNWEAEVVKWLGKKETRRLGLFTLESSREKKMSDRVRVVKQWYKRGGIFIMGYELYRLLVLQSSGEDKIAAGNQKYAHLIKQVYPYLSDPGPDLIVLDEGHRVRNHKSKMVKALAHVKTSRRIILTGYPLQNHLEEYWTMVNFARPDFLGSLEEFKNRFVDPIKNAQCIDSSEADLKLARQRAFVLTRELKPLVLRRDQQYLFKQLPPKKEYVLMCKLTDPQAQLYREFLQHGVPTRGGSDKVDVLGGYHIALAISNHPDVICETYKRLEEEERNGKKKKRGVLDLFGVEDGGNDFDPYDDAPGGRPRGRRALSPAPRGPRVVNDDDDEDEEALLNMLDTPGALQPKPQNKFADGWHRLKFAQGFVENYVPHQLEASGKMMILMELLSACQEVGDRVIIFSQSIPTLDTIGLVISKHNKYQKRHAKRLNYLRIDGSTSPQDRFRQIAQFNDLEEDVDVMMISTKAGGEGINLCAGNRIIIFDVCWNPCNDSQSMCRSYRFGQTKPVFVYRFVTMGTMEKKVYDLQIRKEGVAKRIVDEKTTERKFMSSELQNYFKIDDFEDSLLHAQGKTGDEEADAVQAIPHEDPVLEGILVEMRDRATSTTHTTGEITAEGMLADRRCIIDWFEQETMFEEDLDQQCTPTEQKEIIETYTYFKAVQQLRKNGSHLISREGLLMKHCEYCRVPNEIYPTTTTSVPIPSKIECTYCKRTITTTGGVPPSELPATGYPFMGYMPSVPMPGVPVPAPGMIPPTAVPVPVAGAAPAQNGGRILPPHMQALFDQQQRDSKAAEKARADLILKQQIAQKQRDLQRKQAEIETEVRRQERVKMKLSDRHLLVLRRGIKGCQGLKRQAEECGATLAIEVNSQTTDIVSAMSRGDTLKWLKLSKLPGDVELHDDVWLRNEIAKEKGLPLIPVHSDASTTTDASKALAESNPSVATPVPTSTTTSDQSPQTTVDSNSDFIELLDSDDESPKPANGQAASGNGITRARVPDDDDVIEIL